MVGDRTTNISILTLTFLQILEKCLLSCGLDFRDVHLILFQNLMMQTNEICVTINVKNTPSYSKSFLEFGSCQDYTQLKWNISDSQSAASLFMSYQWLLSIFNSTQETVN